jgi:hypothetical protein
MGCDMFQLLSMYSSAQFLSLFAGADSTQFYECFKLHKKGGGIPYFWGIDFEDVLEFAAEEVQAEDWTEG